jgi:hypothetical protein
MVCSMLSRKRPAAMRKSGTACTLILAERLCQTPGSETSDDFSLHSKLKFRSKCVTDRNSQPKAARCFYQREA